MRDSARFSFSFLALLYIVLHLKKRFFRTKTLKLRALAVTMNVKKPFDALFRKINSLKKYRGQWAPHLNCNTVATKHP